MKIRSYFIAITLLALSSAQIQASIITWNFEFEPATPINPNSIQEGSLELIFESTNIRSIINGSYFDIEQWWISDFNLSLNGYNYNAGPPRNPGTYPGVLSQEFYDSGAINHPLHILNLDLDLENGGVFYLSIKSNLGYGDIPIFSNGDVHSLAEPLGELSPQFVSTLIQGTLPNGDSFNGDVSSWTVPEPSVIALMGIGLVGLGFAQRHKKANKARASKRNRSLRSLTFEAGR
jgi:hypothetical protein